MLRHFLRLLLILTLVWNTSYANAPLKNPGSSLTRPEVQQFIQEMHHKHKLNKRKLMKLFKAYHPNQKILITMDKQFEALPWYQYRASLITEKRALEGARFWKENQTLLKKAEQHFGVPAEIIVAIIGIESSYGKRIGTYPVFQTLATLAFDYPRRSAFFKKELEHFLLLSEEGALHPLKTPGSYAGAIGMPQFMPSSYRQYAVNFSGTGKRDLIYNKADVIGSVANYLKTHGWQAHKPIAQKAKLTQSYAKQAKTRLTLGELAKHHIQLSSPLSFKDPTQKINLIELQNSKYTKEYWIGFHNFYVITRYNHSNHYAMAVYLLGERIRHLYQRVNP